MSASDSIFQRLLRWPRYLSRAAPDAGLLYDLRGEGAIQTGGDVPVVNMGYWDGIGTNEPRALERAVYALFDVVAKGARINGDDAWVVDAGCGFGTNAVHIAEQFGPGRVTGVNVSGVQLETARRRVTTAGLDGRVDFVHGSVTALPMGPGTVDCVVSVEAAFHFDTRDAFFAEAFRVLRPGGRLSLVDLVAVPPKSLFHRAILPSILRAQAIPAANIYDRAAYVARVEAAGFVVEVTDSILDRVFPHFRRWQLTRPIPLLFRYDLLFILASLPYLFYPWDYVRLVARKPA